MSRPPRAAVDVVVAVASGPQADRIARWTRAILSGALNARRARARHGKDRGPVRRPPASLAVLVCGDTRMRRLNRTWRGKDRPTDVLSFPSGEDLVGAPPSLGDLAIDLPQAARQARRLGHGLERELQILLVHGVLHLLGMDHETDSGEMFEEQRRLVRAAFGAGPDGVP